MHGYGSYQSGHFPMYPNIKSLCCAPNTNTMFCVNRISVKHVYILYKSHSSTHPSCSPPKSTCASFSLRSCLHSCFCQGWACFSPTSADIQGHLSGGLLAGREVSISAAGGPPAQRAERVKGSVEAWSSLAPWGQCDSCLWTSDYTLFSPGPVKPSCGGFLKGPPAELQAQLGCLSSLAACFADSVLQLGGGVTPPGPALCCPQGGSSCSLQCAFHPAPLG